MHGMQALGDKRMCKLTYWIILGMRRLVLAWLVASRKLQETRDVYTASSTKSFSELLASSVCGLTLSEAGQPLDPLSTQQGEAVNSVFTIHLLKPMCFGLDQTTFCGNGFHQTASAFL